MSPSELRKQHSRRFDALEEQQRSWQRPRRDPPILVFGLHEVLCHVDAKGGNLPIVRPFLSSFFQYIFGRDPPVKEGELGTRRFRVVLRSPLPAKTVLSTLMALDLFCPKVSTTTCNEPESVLYTPTNEKKDMLSMLQSPADLQERMQPANLKNIWQKLRLDVGAAILRTAHCEKQLPYLIEKSSIRVEAGAKVTRPLDSTFAGVVDCYNVPRYKFDSSLLCVVYILERLRRHTNFSGALRNGITNQMKEGIKL
ncbi:hypothetical protein JCM11641_001194 [Rhodosporidiobolus odoratus]